MLYGVVTDFQCWSLQCVSNFTLMVPHYTVYKNDLSTVLSYLQASLFAINDLPTVFIRQGVCNQPSLSQPRQLISLVLYEISRRLLITLPGRQDSLDSQASSFSDSRPPFAVLCHTHIIEHIDQAQTRGSQMVSHPPRKHTCRGPHLTDLLTISIKRLQERAT